MEQEKNSCPRCGGALENGFLQGTRRLAFVKKFRWWNLQDEVDYLLPCSPLKGTYLPGQYCEHCKTLTISLEDKGE